METNCQTIIQPKIILVCIGSVLVVIAFQKPEWINDENGFLKGFMNHEYLNVLGVILAITLASLAQIHLSLNRIEEQIQPKTLRNSRKEIREAAYYLIGLFLVGVIVVIVKPILKNLPLPICVDVTALINALAIFILLFYIFILFDVTQATFSISANVGNSDDEDR